MIQTKTIPATQRARRMARPSSAGAEVPGSAEQGAPIETAPGVLAPPSPARPTKTGIVLGLLGRSQGATLAELTAATDWQIHSVRAHITGLRKKGHAIVRSERDTAACYRVESK